MYLSGPGMVCSVGLSAATACAAMRAGIAKFDEWPFHYTEGGAIVGAAVPGLGFRLKQGPRVVELLCGALADCLKEATGLRTENVPLLVGLAEPGRPGGGGGLADTLVATVQGKLNRRFHPTLSRAFARGHTAGFEALRVARELLGTPDVSACLVAGVDSYFNAASLQWLEQDSRLKTPENSNGVIPGEAAAVVLVQRQPASVAGVTIQVAGLGFAVEKASVLSEEPLLGLGLAEAARQALTEAKVALHEMDFRLSDVTGESYGFKEQTLLLARAMRGRREAFPIWHCADAIGDTGAAAGVCHLVRAWHAFQKGYAPGDRGIGFASSVPGERAVVILKRQTPAGGGGAVPPSQARRG